ncbi:MAG: hypothetical protein AAFO69_03590 [Bacteroidota bacterium]
MSFKSTVGLLFTLLISSKIYAHEYLVFGEVSMEELQKKESSIEPSADAEVLAEYGTVDENGKYIRFIRTKIYNQDGYSYADLRIPKYSSAKILKIRGFTYNLVGGQIEKTPLAEDQIIEEKVADDIKQIKITFPQVKPGSVLDFEIVRKFKQGRSIREWVFQKSIPVVWSELIVTKYLSDPTLFFNQGLIPYKQSDQREITKSTTRYQYRKVQSKWAHENLKPLKDENYISSKENFIAKLTVQDASISSYYTVNSRLFAYSNFNEGENKVNFLKSVVEGIGEGKPEAEKAEEIYHLIRDNMKWDGYYGIIPSNSKEAWKNKEGDVPTINYLLTAALKKAGFNTAPVMLNTRDEGFINEEYFIRSRTNYLICCVKIDNEWVFLDASSKNNPFGILPYRCLNVRGWKLSEVDPGWMDLVPKKVSSTTTQVNIALNKDGIFLGDLTVRSSSYRGISKRLELKRKEEEEFLKDADQALQDWTLTNLQTKNKDDFSKPMVTSFDIENSDNEGSDFIYLGPVIFHQFKSNPFVSDERMMPVDFAYKQSERYIATITLPDNYEIDELPESTVFQIPNKDMQFQYSVTSVGKKISIISSFKINGLFYPKEGYDGLKKFFEMMVSKQSEQIVLKRTN